MIPPVTLPPKAAPETRFALLDDYFARAIIGHRPKRRTALVGLAGPQGCGKSTSAARMVERLRSKGVSALACSLDDFYLTAAERGRLARDIHPLLATRGVPGTHDIDLLQRTLTALRQAGPGDRTPLPTFDKIADDRKPPDSWPLHEGICEVVLLEGWCVGVRAEPESRLATALNALERDDDPGGDWRRYVNEALAGYAPLFASIDLQILYRSPDFAIVHRWRDEQEEKMARSQGRERLMDAEQISRFIAHYERLTRWMMDDEPADIVIDLDESRAPIACRIGRRPLRST